MDWLRGLQCGHGLGKIWWVQCGPLLSEVGCLGAVWMVVM